MLGYEKFAEELCSATGYKSVDQAREVFLLSPFRSRCKEISETYNAKLQLGNDDCYFLTSEVETLFKVVSQISSIDIPIQKFDFIPISVALDIIDINFPSLHSLASSSVIASLKTNLIEKFKIHYKNTYHDSIKESFLICSRMFYEHLDNLEKEHYHKVKLYESDVEFYNGNLNHFTAVIHFIYSKINNYFLPSE